LKVINGHEVGLPPHTGEVYVTCADPGCARGNHYHPKSAEWFTLLVGRAKLIAQDPMTGERRTWLLTAEEPKTVFMPAGVGHVFINPANASGPFILIAYAEYLYSPDDTVPLNIPDKD
jgi:oxalate decarboxylase/phosphoglucose isomerase-like protein (cupin superfamily)